MPLQPFHVPGVRVWNGGTTACILTAPRPARAAAWRAHRGKAGRLPVAHLLVRLGARALARRVHLRRLGEVAKTPRSCPGRAPTPPASLVLYLRVPNKTTREPGGDRRPSLRPAAPGRRSLRSDQRATEQRRSWGQSEVDQSINSMPAPDRATPRTGFSQGRRRAFHKVRATKPFAMPPPGSRRSPLWHRWRLTCLSWHLSTIPSDISATAPWRVPTAANGRSLSPRRGST